MTTGFANACSDAAPFALRVTDDSMEPEFRRNCIVIIDPTGHARDGAYVLAEVDGDYIFRQLRLNGDGVWLEALKKTYPTLSFQCCLCWRFLGFLSVFMKPWRKMHWSLPSLLGLSQPF